MVSLSEISSWYANHFEGRLLGRYICQKEILPILTELSNFCPVEVLGTSEEGRNIHLIKFGNGSKKILAWSQMHGNESTTTKAVFDLLKFLNQKDFFQKEIHFIKNEFSIYIIPMLNPDGAIAYTRENANKIDLNRDAKDLTQAESCLLRTVFNTIEPQICLNLHDQRTIYSLPNNKSATLSFLAPTADDKRTITRSRKEAMLSIAKINEVLQFVIPGQVGRYDDTFNNNCVGDSFQQMGVPTILFEAGHFPLDFQREKTREFIFYAFLALLNVLPSTKSSFTVEDYLQIPENEKNFRDVLLRNAILNGEKVDVAIQFQEKLRNGQIQFIPIIDEIAVKVEKMGHKEIDIKNKEILINSHENVFVDEEISMICYKTSKKPIYLQ
ncbi:MAG: M14 family zinc carboxypeptidase [Flavobacteriaceae bacterium]